MGASVGPSPASCQLGFRHSGPVSRKPQASREEGPARTRRAWRGAPRLRLASAADGNPDSWRNQPNFQKAAALASPDRAQFSFHGVQCCPREAQGQWQGTVPSGCCPGSPRPQPAALLSGALISTLGVSFRGHVTPFNQVQDSFQINYFFYSKSYIHSVDQKANKTQVPRGAVPCPRVCTFSAPAPSRLYFSMKAGPHGSVTFPPARHDVFGRRSVSVPPRRLFKNALSRVTLRRKCVTIV